MTKHGACIRAPRFAPEPSTDTILSRPERTGHLPLVAERGQDRVLRQFGVNLVLERYASASSRVDELRDAGQDGWATSADRLSR
jgi:hypothetical protein